LKLRTLKGAFLRILNDVFDIWTDVLKVRTAEKILNPRTMYGAF